MRTTPRRRAVGALTAALAAAALTPTLAAPATASPAPAAAAAAATVTGTARAATSPAGTAPLTRWSDPAAAAATYLARELASRDGVLTTTYEGTGYPDWGLTADAVLGLDAAGAGQDQAARTTAALERHAADYVSGGTKGAESAGAVAKLLNVAAAQGADPADFGGYDLPAVLTGLEAPTGRYRDDAPSGDYSNVIGQSLGVIGLDRTGHTPSPQAVAFLRAQQCDDGGFRLDPAASPCESDPDATAFAAQALIATGATTPADAALDHLATLQRDGGGLAGTGPTASVNANTTALSAQAFGAGGRTSEADGARSFLVGLQYGCRTPSAVAGAVAYDRAAMTTGGQSPSSSGSSRAAGGGAAATTDQDRRATAQALLALAGTPLAEVTARGASASATAGGCADEATSSPPSASAAPTSSPDDAADPWWGTPAALVGAVVVLVLGLGAFLLRRRRPA